MIKIVSKLKLTDLDTCFFTNDDHHSYMQLMGKEADAPPNSLYDIYSDIHPPLIDILEQMLQFNPYFRPTTKELLKHPVFDMIRTDLEYMPQYKVVVDIDCNE